MAMTVGFAALLLASPSAWASDIKDPPRWTSPKDFTAARDWHLKATNLVPHGHHPLFYPLVPGHKHALEKPDHLDGQYRRETTVLDTTEEFDVPGLGSFRTAVVQDEEIVDGIINQRIFTWLAPLVALVRGAGRTMHVIRRNIAFSLLYNVAGATLAITGGNISDELLARTLRD